MLWAMLRDGYIERAIQKLAEAVARAVGLRTAGKAEEALEHIQAAKAALPVVPGVLEVLSAKDLRQALGADEVVARYAELLREEALAYMAIGREREAVRALHRAERVEDELRAENG